MPALPPVIFNTNSVTMQSQFNQHQRWCVGFAKRLTSLGEWLEKNKLADASVYAEVNRLRYQLTSQQIMVAVVAEFSRGKSELINALFFAEYGRRIMPAGAGRTTMCPAEIAWNPALPIGIRLLPINTRKDTTSMAHWRQRPEAWITFAFNPQEPAAMAQTIAKVGDVQRVSVEEATALGFWLPNQPNGERNLDNPVPDRLGQVEVPVWRHACINIPHPLLAQGLVILDTPGLNAVGVEPDLTMALLGQAQATLFILSADTGVTKSDLDLWREHLGHAAASHIPRYALLNKIDMLWDDLKSPAEVTAELEKQCISTAQLLSISRQSVIAISAQKALLAKIGKDAPLLERSGLLTLEDVLGGHLVRERQSIIQQNCMSGLMRLQATATDALARRVRDLVRQKSDIQSTIGKSEDSKDALLADLHLEKQKVAEATKQFKRAQNMCLEGTHSALAHINSRALKAQMNVMNKAFSGKLLKVGLKQHYEDGFSALAKSMQSCQTDLMQLHDRLLEKTQAINTQHGFVIALVSAPNMTDFATKINNVRLTHLHHLDFAHSWRLMSKDHLQRLLQILYTQVRVIFEMAQEEVNAWMQSTMKVLQTELTERGRTLAQRTEAVLQIGHSSTTAEAQIAQIDTQLMRMRAQGRQLNSIVKGLGDDALVASQPVLELF